jgi:hypothetical protein
MKKITFIMLPALVFAFIAFGAKLSPNPETQTKVSEQKTESITAVNNFTVSGRRVLLNGQPFYAKGVGYQPIPRGEEPKNYPNGDYFTSNYSYIYKPDLERMRAMGVNMIKIYSWYPDHDHSDFLKECWNNGVDPIYVGVGYFLEAGAVIRLKNEYINQFKILAQNTYTNPAIMGYMIGNETNNEDDINNPRYWAALNEMAGAIKAITTNKITFIAEVDDGMRTVIKGNSQFPNLDVWGINVFRGRSLTDIYTSFQSATTKPLFITEIGFSSTIRENGVPQPMPDNGQGVAFYAKLLLTEIGKNRSIDDPSRVVAGTIWFMFCDEWWKQNCPQCYNNIPCTPNNHDYSNVPNGNFPGGWDDQEWFGLYTIERSPREAVTVIKSFWKNSASPDNSIISTDQTPFQYKITQNYPNPFNPTTSIRYQTGNTGYVTLKVYDALGNEVAVLVNENQSSGMHEAIFDGSNLSSGVYFYKLQAGSFVETKKMLMIK